MYVSNNLSLFGAAYYGKQQNQPAAAPLQGFASVLKMNSRADDASGLLASRRMRVRIAELNAADNSITFEPAGDTQDDIFDSAMELLGRMSRLAKQAHEGGMDTDRYALNAEYQQLVKEMEGFKSSQSQQVSYTMLNFGQAASPRPDPNDASAVTITGKNYRAFMDAMESHIRELSEAAGPDVLSPDALSSAAVSFARQYGQSCLDTEEGAGSADVSITVSGGNIYLHNNVSLDNINLSGTDLLTNEGVEAALEAIQGAVDDIEAQREEIKCLQEELQAFEDLVNKLHGDTLAARAAELDAAMARDTIVYIREQASLRTSTFGMVHGHMEAGNVVSLLES